MSQKVYEAYSYGFIGDEMAEELSHEIVPAHTVWKFTNEEAPVVYGQINPDWDWLPPYKPIKCQFLLKLTIQFVHFRPLTTFNRPGTTVEWITMSQWNISLQSANVMRTFEVSGRLGDGAVRQQLTASNPQPRRGKLVNARTSAILFPVTGLFELFKFSTELKRGRSPSAISTSRRPGVRGENLESGFQSIVPMHRLPQHFQQF